jgi:hypothetical protein
LERETGIEPATNSLEGCDSTTELLPPVMSKNHVPQGLKPVCAADLGSTAKAVPFRVSLKLELMTGIEPVTSPLPRECSTD